MPAPLTSTAPIAMAPGVGGLRSALYGTPMPRFLLPSVIIVVALGIAILALTLNWQQDDAAKGTFDPAIWSDEARIQNEPYPRRQMVTDVIGNHLAIGQTRSQVTALLGAPTETEKFANRGMVYWLGPESGAISVDSAWLVLDFDAAGALSGFEIMTD